MGKFQDISATPFLHESDFDNFEGLYTAIFTIWAALYFGFLEISDIFKFKITPKSKFKASKNVKMADFNLKKSAKIDFT